MAIESSIPINGSRYPTENSIGVWFDNPAGKIKPKSTNINK